MIPSAVQALIDAANDNDIEAFLAGFTQDGVVDGGLVSRMTIRA